MAVAIRVRRLGALQARSLGCMRFDITCSTPSHQTCTLAEVEGLEPPRTRFWRPPLSPLSYTSSANLNKKAASVDPGRLACLGLVVSLFKTSTSAPRRP